jgi:acyl carrier protein phosphodiesterase
MFSKFSLKSIPFLFESEAIMNFLAHLYLSGNNPEIMVGNFIGDFVRGRNVYDQFKYNIALGIELHRQIDEFTDSHPVVLESKKRLRPKYRHYAPVIIDVFYDHFLAIHWPDYHPQSLPDFANHAYVQLENHEGVLPERVLQMMPYMIKGNWLVNYAKAEGIHRALTGMSRRTPYDSKMDEAIHDLEKYYTEFDNEFSRFFPELKQLSESFIISKLNH